MARSRARIATPLVVLLIGIAAYTGYWFWLTARLQTGIVTWIQEQQAEGIQLRHGAMTRAGFPLRAEIHLDKPTVAHADQGVRWQWRTDALAIASPLYRFDRLTLRALGPSRTVLAVGGKQTVFTSAEAQTELAFDHEALVSLASTSRDAVITSPDLAAPLHIGAVRVEQALALPGRDGLPNKAVALRVEDVQLPDLADTPLGGRVALIEARGMVRGVIPAGPLRASVIGWRDQGGVLDLTDLQFVWGSTRVKGSGTLALDDALRPIGAFSVRVAGYNWLLDQFVARDQLNQSYAGLAKSLLSGIAQQPGNKDGVPIPIRIQDGRVWLGPKAVADVPPVL